MYIDRDIDIYWYYNDKSYNSDDNGVGVDDDGNNGDSGEVAVSWKSEIWKQIVTDFCNRFLIYHLIPLSLLLLSLLLLLSFLYISIHCK